MKRHPLGIDAPTWIKMVRQLNLTRSEQEVVRRFEQDPSGRQFLPLSDLLRNHKLIEESLELLTQGVQDHPGFAVARVVLCRELFQRGLLLDAWNVLEQAPAPLVDNVLALKLRYKMAVLLGDETTVRSTFQHLRIQQGIDPEIKKISDQMEIDGIVSTRETFRDDLIRRGIDVRLPQSSPKLPKHPTVKKGELPAIPSPGQKKFILDYEISESTRKDVEKFHVVPLMEVFVPGTYAEQGTYDFKHANLELDSTTLAEIYTEQGVYSKALAIYRRLLRMAPHNDLIRLKVSELARLDRIQRQDDLEQDPVVFDRLEVADLIDRQMRFMTGLLNKLN
jgi:tetratricopeptide (TPR) repeat protein